MGHFADELIMVIDHSFNEGVQEGVKRAQEFSDRELSREMESSREIEKLWDQARLEVDELKAKIKDLEIRLACRL